MMKLAFSTLGCPDWTLEKIISNARGYGFSGIEIRGVGEHLDVTMLPQFTSHSQETLRQLEDAELNIVCFSSSILLSPAESSLETPQLEELKRYAELCSRFQTKFIRIFGGKLGQRTWEQAIDGAATYLEKMIAALGSSDVKILVETHDDWLNSHHFHQLLERVPSDHVGLLWDINHPYMFIGEEPARTWHNVGNWIEHTHWKDSRRVAVSPARWEPCLMGEGEVPHQQIYRILRNAGYTGYLSLEWEKRWHPELPPAEMAFPQFVAFMTRLEQGYQNG
ncbi:MAG: sugar phosphate isomerase/epimerase [candidate division KSB1 bacterium]|nr:sugar phosphate isomerase/epimerase [candidate division KSB1 bacterium]